MKKNISDKFILNPVKRISCIVLLLYIGMIFYSCSSADDTRITTDDPETAFAIAMSAYNKRDYLQAIHDFSFIKVRFSGSAVVDKAQYYLAMSHYNRKEYILAAYEFENLLRNYPTSEFIIPARYNMAMSYYHLSPEYYLDQTYTRIAIMEFQNFLELHPEADQAAAAMAFNRSLRNKLALKHLKTAKQYRKMGDNRAAIVYYDYILKDYFDTDYADDALFGKIEILMSRKNYDLAKSEIQRFEEKFAGSPFINRVQSLKNNIPF